MAMWCKACSASDPTTDTVRISFPPAGQQANIKELGDLQEESAKKRAEMEAAEALRKAQEEEEARRRAEAAAAAAAAAAAEEERRRREAEEAEQRRREEEERLRQLAEAEEARKRDEAARLEEQRRKEEAARAEQECLKKQQAAVREKVEAWLKKNGFAGVVEKKKGLFSSSYPLHAAVKSNDAEMVSMLVSMRADPQAKNSSGQTALQLAQKSDKNGSYSDVMRALGVGVGVGGA